MSHDCSDWSYHANRQRRLFECLGHSTTVRYRAAFEKVKSISGYWDSATEIRPGEV
jgi:hypothetical protein